MVGDLYIRNETVGVDGHLTGDISFTRMHIQRALIVIIDAVQDYLSVCDCILVILQIIIQSRCTDCDVVQQITKDIYKDTCSSAAQMDFAVQIDIAGILIGPLLVRFCIRIEDDFYKLVDPFNDLLGDPFYEPSDDRDLADLLDDLFNDVFDFRPYILDDGVRDRCCVPGDRLRIQFRRVRNHVDHLAGQFGLITRCDVDMVLTVNT